MVLGLRVLVKLNEGLRYSPLPIDLKIMRNTPKGGVKS